MKPAWTSTSPRHRYLNCPAPFDPRESALAGLAHSAAALRTMLDGFALEYEPSMAQGRGDVWKRAMDASAALFITNVTRPVDEARGP